MKIEFEKIVTNAVSAVVVSVVLGAAAIIWKGATTVDEKVQSTRADMTHLIDALSDELGGQKAQLISLSNQLAVLISNQSVVISQPPKLASAGNPNVEQPSIRKELTAEQLKLREAMIGKDSDNQAVQRKAYSQDIYRQLKR